MEVDVIIRVSWMVDTVVVTEILSVVNCVIVTGTVTVLVMGKPVDVVVAVTKTVLSESAFGILERLQAVVKFYLGHKVLVARKNEEQSALPDDGLGAARLATTLEKKISYSAIV
jgi:hypothetical protein